jgi:hypothetical protein
MGSTRGVPHRSARAAAVSVSAALLGAGAHALGGGRVTLAGVACGVLVLLGPAWLLAGRERGWLPIVAAQLAGQEIVHLLLGAAPLPGAALLPHDLMFALHAVAALLAGSLLRHGERRLWAAAQRMAHAVLAWLQRASAHCPVVPRVRPSWSQPCWADAVRLRHAVARRGPPRTA